MIEIQTILDWYYWSDNPCSETCSSWSRIGRNLTFNSFNCILLKP